MKHLGLFEGIGGFSLAARWMGWETVAWCEINPFCQRVLKHHFPHAEGFTDIKKTDFTKYANRIDILTGGFPCQPYSTAGKRLGKEDDRHLWPEMLRAIREISPRWVVGENVRGLTNWNGGLVFDEVQADLEAQGYEVLPFLLPACSKNAPHRRDRIWFIAYSTSVRCNSNDVKGKGIHGKQTCGETWSGNHKIITDSNQTSTRDQIQTGRDLLTGNVSTNTNGGRFQRSQKKEKRQLTTNGDSWDFFPTQSPICSGNDGFPAGLDGITFSDWREGSIKGYGNAIVPQMAFEIYKAIEQYEILTHK